MFVMPDALSKMPWSVVVTVIVAALSVGGLYAKVEMMSHNLTKISASINNYNNSCSSAAADLTLIKYRLDKLEGSSSLIIGG